MTQKVLKVGSSAAVTIPKRSLSGLGLKPGDSVNVVVVKDTVLITPVIPVKKFSHERRIAALTLGFIDRYRKDLEALAD